MVQKYKCSLSLLCLLGDALLKLACVRCQAGLYVHDGDIQSVQASSGFC